MLLHELKRSKWYNKPGKRLGRGNASWKWNYCGRWIKWQLARSGGWMPAWFEWGQTPLTQRLPKLRGFKKFYKLVKTYAVVNLWKLNEDERIKDGAIIDKKVLVDLWYIKKQDEPVKILAKGELSKKLIFQWIDAFSSKAKELIEKVGGEIK
jgi:large subunit ribosomal protein L15